MDLIHSLLSFNNPKNRPAMFDEFCQFLFEQLMEVRESPYEKEACMYILGGLLPLILKVKNFRDNLLSGLQSAVFPEIGSKHSILRLRAIWLYSKILAEEDLEIH